MLKNKNGFSVTMMPIFVIISSEESVPKYIWASGWLEKSVSDQDLHCWLPKRYKSEKQINTKRLNWK